MSDRHLAKLHRVYDGKHSAKESLPSLVFRVFFVECFLLFAQCFRHLALGFPVVVRQRCTS